MDFLENIKQRAKANRKKILLPESDDERILQGASICQKEGLASPVLLGSKEQIHKKAKTLAIDLDGVEIIDPKQKKEKLLAMMQDNDKQENELEILEKIQNPLCAGALLLRSREVHGLVAGAVHNSSDVIRAGLRYILRKTKNTTVSGMFLAFCSEDIGENGLLGLADCAVNVNPNKRQLMQIAVSSAETMKQLCNLEARIAMLSFSTKKSAWHNFITKVAEATEELQKQYPAMIIDGELQLDAALVPSVAEKKAPDSKLQGNANLLVFPDLNSGNIGYKIIQRIGKAKVIGPILQGFEQPINDLSRGCGVEEIVNMIAITSLQS
jgi:phosphate acetyltransferase